MLEEIHVKDLALIEDAWLEFAPGMTVMTGETGAGKTALVGALKLLVGERADSGSVRAGAPEALVEGRFVRDSEEVVVKRRLSADGRSRCVLDGEMASVSALAERVGPLVDLHGQHDHQALLRPATHVEHLDRWIGEDARDALAAYRSALTEYHEAQTRLEELTEASATAAAEIDRLRFMLDDISRVDPTAGEDDELEAKLPALQHAERLSEVASSVASLLRGDEGALDRLARARAELDRVSGIDPRLDAIGASLAEAEALVDDVGTTARQYRDAVDHDPALVDSVQSRLAAIAGLKKRYGPSLDDVIDARRRASDALSLVAASDEALRAAEAAVSAARSTLEAAGASLDAVRRSGAAAFCSALETETADLCMAGVRFDVALEGREFDSWTADGPSRVEIEYSPAAAQPPRPLARIASGGELSRVMLALKSVLRGADRVATLVFDEIDAGIGGATAQAVGAKLAALAGTHQVVVITHLAQVASFADRHLVVRKRVVDGEANTEVVEVQGDERVAELARMLAGNDSEASIAHAREVLESSRAQGGHA